VQGFELHGDSFQTVRKRCIGRQGIGALPGTEVVAEPVINQGLVRFLAEDGNHDCATDKVIRRIQAKGVAWFGGATWRGMRVMRVSVCNWLTIAGDVERTLASIAEVLAERRAGR